MWARNSMSEAETKTGVAKWWNINNGYGFLIADDYTEYFGHISEVVDAKIDGLTKNQRVSWISDVARDGKPFARRILVLKV